MKRFTAILASMFLLVALASPAFADAYKDFPRGTFDSGNGVGGPPQNGDDGDDDGHDGHEGHKGGDPRFVAGFMAQGTLNSAATISPLALNTQEIGSASSGKAGQGAIGGYIGGIKPKNCNPYMISIGGSFVKSYSFDKKGRGFRSTEAGNLVGAGTIVLSAKSKDVYGGYVAGGFAGSHALSVLPTGYGEAYNVGIYAGAGELGTNFAGGTVGGTKTSVTQFRYPGKQGTVATSASFSAAGVGHSATPGQNSKHHD